MAFLCVSLYFINVMHSQGFKQILSWHRIRSIVCTTQSMTGECWYGRTLYQPMDQIRPKTGNPLVICFGFSLFYYYYVFLIYIYIIISQENMKSMHKTNEDWWGLLWIILCQIMYCPQPKTGNYLEICSGLSLFY